MPRPRSSSMRSSRICEKQAQPLLAQYHELMSKDLPALNEMVNKQNMPALYVPAGK